MQFMFRNDAAFPYETLRAADGQKSELTRNRILDATRHLFNEHLQERCIGSDRE
jgi:hypothetical protein